MGAPAERISKMRVARGAAEQSVWLEKVQPRGSRRSDRVRRLMLMWLQSRSRSKMSAPASPPGPADAKSASVRSEAHLPNAENVNEFCCRLVQCSERLCVCSRRSAR